jgi:integrase
LLRLRPNGKHGKPVSVSWTQNCIKQLRQFLKWLNRSPEFAWKRPTDLELPRIHIPLTAEEKSARGRSLQVQTYTLEELRLLWEHASPFRRLLLLLALNCGFGRAEIASLELGEVLLGQKHPHEREVGYSSSAETSWIFRIRNKTGVYGEYKLWPETVQAIEWWLRRRAGISVAPGITTLLVTGNGNRYDKSTKGNNANCRISNSWLCLSKRIKKAHPTFRCLSFNKLRKTAGNLVRAQAGGEIAAVFLCHGTPVKANELLDVYTNRPFAKVFAALDLIGEQLRPLWTRVVSR